MTCPYCGSRKVADEYTVRTYDVGDEWIAINELQCGKCHAHYSKTIRDNIRTGKRKVTISKTEGGYQVSANRSKGFIGRLFGRLRR